ncbi:MAG TPA: type IV pilus secretin PilQ [Thermodesulfovibrionales bacterium]|jgi:type IV pilus secretin PilQ/predicted competence protein|nr:type IV pilus secretin PilQ [Thermodesulfovibrionales bacterium]
MKEQRMISMILFMTILAFIGGCATSGKVRQEPMQEEAVITDIIISDNKLEIKANGPFAYTVYKPSDPFRVVLEMPGVSTGAYKDKIVSRSAGITEVIPTQADSQKPTAKIEVLLQSPSHVEPSYHDNVLTVTVKEPGEAKPMTTGELPVPAVMSMEKTAAEVKEEDKETKGESISVTTAGETAPMVEETALLSKASEIREIRLEQTDGTVNCIIRGDGSMTPTVFTLRSRIVVDIPNVNLRAKLPSAVIAPVKGIRAGKHGEKTRLVIDLREMKNFDVSSVKDTVIIAIQGAEAGIVAAKREAPSHGPQRTGVEEKKEDEQRVPSAATVGEVAEIKEAEVIVEGKYSGKKISLDFQDADIVPIFRLLSDISGYNIVVSPEVKGKLTMKLINVPWDQALDLILKTFSLGKSVEGNIIRIAPLSVLAKESEDKARAKEAEVKAEPLETKIFLISFADLTVVEKNLKDSKVLSARGSISTDKRTSSIVVKDVPSVMRQIENILLTLDQATPQVMIEARIVEVSINDLRDLGIQWGLTLNASNTLSSLTGLSSLNKGSFTGNPLVVDLPAGSVSAGSGSGFTFGLLNPSKTLGLDLQLSALESTGRTKIISNPKVVTIDNEKATIMQGTSEPYPQLTPEGTISTAFKDVVLSTEVTPHITPGGSVSMSVLVKKEDILGTVKIAGSDVPRTSKIEGNTKVLVQNGETLVIGGVYKKTTKESSSGVPGLMKLPIIGSLFRTDLTSEDTAELLIFITPRIVGKL